MSATVFVTRGRKYHADENCPLMVGGEGLWYTDDWFPGTYRRSDTVAHAAACGKLPCLACVPPEQRAFPPLYGQSFGHQPEPLYAPGPLGPGDDQLVCARCAYTAAYLIDIATDDLPIWGDPVPWPCASAVVLGIAGAP